MTSLVADHHINFCVGVTPLTVSMTTPRKSRPGPDSKLRLGWKRKLWPKPQCNNILSTWFRQEMTHRYKELPGINTKSITSHDSWLSQTEQIPKNFRLKYCTIYNLKFQNLTFVMNNINFQYKIEQEVRGSQISFLTKKHKN